jgi:hypothetical protein
LILSTYHLAKKGKKERGKKEEKKKRKEKGGGGETVRMSTTNVTSISPLTENLKEGEKKRKTHSSPSQPPHRAPPRRFHLRSRPTTVTVAADATSVSLTNVPPLPDIRVYLDFPPYDLENESGHPHPITYLLVIFKDPGSSLWDITQILSPAFATFSRLRIENVYEVTNPKSN